tara:strand:- start:113372 stop:113791 length:420 start_codon:yes stop_codon:yes gene_type:complete
MKTFKEFLNESPTGTFDFRNNKNELFSSAKKEAMKLFPKIFDQDGIKVKVKDGEFHSDLMKINLIGQSGKFATLEIYGHEKGETHISGMRLADKLVAEWKGFRLYDIRTVSSSKSVENLFKKIERSIKKNKETILSSIQ